MLQINQIHVRLIFVILNGRQSLAIYVSYHIVKVVGVVSKTEMYHLCFVLSFEGQRLPP